MEEKKPALSALLHTILNHILIWFSQNPRRGRVLEEDIGMLGQPPIGLGLVGVEIVQYDVEFPIGEFSDEFVHKTQELASSALLVMPGLDPTGSDAQCSRPSRKWVSLVFAIRTGIALPLGNLSHPWTRSGAWIAGFSSTHNSMTCAFLVLQVRLQRKMRSCLIMLLANGMVL